MGAGMGHPLLPLVQRHHQADRRGGVRQAGDPQATGFEQPGECRGGGGDAVGDVDLVVGDQGEAAGEQAQQQVGLPRTGGSDEQDAGPVTGGTACVHALRSSHGTAM